MFNNNKGYHGYSESVRSRQAKDKGIYPLSLWNKDKMLEVLEYEEREDLADKINNIPLYVLKETCLIYSEWHHTSSKYNITNFYKFSIEMLENLTDEDIEKIREKKRKENQELKEVRVKRKKERDLKKYRLSLMQYSKYKRESAYLKAIEEGRLNIKDLELIKLEDDKKRLISSFNGSLGNLVKYTNYKSYEELRNAIISNEFNPKDIKEIDEQRDRSNLNKVIENLEEYKKLIKD